MSLGVSLSLASSLMQWDDIVTWRTPVLSQSQKLKGFGTPPSFNLNLKLITIEHLKIKISNHETERKIFFLKGYGHISSITLVFSYWMSTVSFAIQAQFSFLDVVPPLQASYHGSQTQPLLALFGSDHNHWYILAAQYLTDGLKKTKVLINVNI